MANLIALSNAGAVRLMIALFTIGVLQTIECRQDEGLWKELETKSKVVDVENLLNAVGDKDNIEFGRYKLSDIWSLKSNAGENCDGRYLEEGFKMWNYFFNKNRGLYTFTSHYFKRHAKLCFYKTISNFDKGVKDNLKPEDIDVLEKFWSLFDASEYYFYSGRKFQVQVPSVLSRWKLQSTEEDKANLKTSCTKLESIKDEHVPEDFWHLYHRYLYGQNLEDGKWYKFWAVCSHYLYSDIVY